MDFGIESGRGRRAFGTRAFFTVAALFVAAAFTTPARAEEEAETQSFAAIEGVDLVDKSLSSAFVSLETPFSNDDFLGEYFQTLGQNRRQRENAVNVLSPEERLERAALNFVGQQFAETTGLRIPRGLSPYAKDLGSEGGDRDIVVGIRFEW